MTKGTDRTGPKSVRISADLDLAGADRARTRLLKALGDGGPVQVEIASGTPTQPALQILFAAARTGEGESRIGFGTRATEIISLACDGGPR